ncbi:unnamed protein product [Moneuplotes crassus]|uniref:Uncharacterized protein n=1 Tax=Euplotes crassus TaxID=5936 RepID=A0AAD1Y1H1_EUPCR|nr:unnamed protein product [Moneuplotes crassus]
MRTKSLETAQVESHEEVKEILKDLENSIQDLYSPVKSYKESLKCKLYSWVDQLASYTDSEQQDGFVKSVDNLLSPSDDLVRIYFEFQKQARIKTQNTRTYISAKGYMTDDVSSQIDEIVKPYYQMLFQL